MSYMDKIAQAAAQTNMNEAVAGGGGLELPAFGPTRLRLISYIELGVHPDDYQGTVTNKEMVYLEFELSGPRHPPKGEGDSKRTGPFTINFTLPKSQNEKSNFYKLFKRLNPEGKYTHFAQLLGHAFIGTVVHSTRGEGADAKTYANLRDQDGLTIKPPFVMNPETDEMMTVKVAEPVSPLRCFLWDYADKEMWDSIYIDGRWDDKKDAKGVVTKEGISKNYFQMLIAKAVNFAGSPAGNLVAAGGQEVDLGDAEQPERQAPVDPLADDADPLAGV